MTARRHGSPVAFWGTLVSQVPTAEAVSGSAKSRAVQVGEDADQTVFQISVSAATTIVVQVANQGALTADGFEPDKSSPPADAFFYPLTYLGTAISVTFAGAGTTAIMVPDWAATWVRLTSSGAANIIAGLEVANT